jgi:hypothetical protein
MVRPIWVARRVWVLLIALNFVACQEEQVAKDGPVVTETSSKAVVVGQTVEFYGKRFLKEKEGKTRLIFDGVFQDIYGNAREVNLIAPTFYGGREIGEDGREILTWSRFGPFSNPFTKDKSLGLFKGTVQVENEHKDGTIELGAPAEFALEVGPSVIINKLEPLESDCGAPVVRILAGIPYKMSVSVSGIKPTRFVYEFNMINGKKGITRFEHTLNQGQPAEEDTVGVYSEMVVFNQIPEGEQAYVTGIRVQAFDDGGRYVETALPIGVHRPVESSYDGSYELAERYEPQPVSGCIPGSIDSRVDFSKTETESRAQAVSVTMSSSWVASKGVNVSENASEGLSVGQSQSKTIENSQSENESFSNTYGLTYFSNQSNQVGFETSSSNSVGWNLSQGDTQESYMERMESNFNEVTNSSEFGIKGELSFAEIVDVGGHVSNADAVTNGSSTGSSFGSRQRLSTNRGYSMASTNAQSQSFGSTTSNGQSQSVSGTYVQGRGKSTSQLSGEELSNTKTWSVNQGKSSEEVLSQGNSRDITNSIVTSEDKSITNSFSGFIPNGRFGILYRQTTRWVKRVEVISYDLCGVGSHMGEIQFNEWNWAVDLAVGSDCTSTPPPSAFPKAKCFIDPCGE